MKWTSAVAASVAVVLLAACQASSEAPPDTVGSLPIESAATTLLPEVVISFVPDDTLPPGVLFGGNPCTALVVEDFAAVTIAGAGRGRLLETQDLADDICGYLVRAGGDDHTIIVRARSGADFEQPATTDFDPEALTGIGETAMGVDRGDTYEVYVKVANGYFSVTTPDRASARALAQAAAGRAQQD